MTTKPIIETLCRSALIAFRDGLLHALAVECRDGGPDSDGARLLHQAIIDANDEIKRIESL